MRGPAVPVARPGAGVFCQRLAPCGGRSSACSAGQGHGAHRHVDDDGLPGECRDPRIPARHAGRRGADRTRLHGDRRRRLGRRCVGRCARRRDRRLRDSDDDYFRARAADLNDIRGQVLRGLSGWRRSEPAGRHPVRRRHHADPLPRDRLEPRRRHRAAAAARPAMSPCWRARAACRWWSGSAPRRSRSTALRCSMPSMAASCSAPTAADIESFRRAAHEYRRAPRARQ